MKRTERYAVGAVAPSTLSIPDNGDTHPGRTPFIKWPGGKRWLSSLIGELFDPERRHIEAFVGSGAAFFASQAERALLADANAELINCFSVVKSNCEELVHALSKLRISHRQFTSFRGLKPHDSLGRAVRFIYLNRTAFNGLYRVNRAGQFNVPFGCKASTKLCVPELFTACSRRLRSVELRHGNFLDTLTRATAKDCIYLDPPYTTKHLNGTFRRYNESIFSWGDQTELASCANRLARSGARVIVSNADHADVIELYDLRVFIAFSIQRTTNLAASTAARGTCRELLLVSKAIAAEREDLREDIRRHFLGRARRLRLK